MSGIRAARMLNSDAISILKANTCFNSDSESTVTEMQSQGAQSTVYEAIAKHECAQCNNINNNTNDNNETGIRVVIKTELSTGTDTPLTREWQMYNDLVNVPNIVKIYPCLSSIDGNFKYITMQKVKFSLQNKLDVIQGWDNKLRIRFALQLGLCLLTALEGIHSKGIVHYDIKPANIGINFEPSPKIFEELETCPNTFMIDFGISGKENTKTTQFRGSPIYMSLAHANSMIHHSADIESLGHVLIQIITGSRLYDDMMKTDDVFTGGFKNGKRKSKHGGNPMIISWIRYKKDFYDKVKEILETKIQDNECIINLLLKMITYGNDKNVNDQPTGNDIDVNYLSKNPYVQNEYQELKNMILSCMQQVGGGKMKYKGRSYKVRYGERGGKYIIVGKEKKRVYIK